MEGSMERDTHDTWGSTHLNLPRVISSVSTDQSKLSLARGIMSTSSSYLGVREEAGSLNSSASTSATSNSSELDQPNSMLSARSKENADRASGSGMRAAELADRQTDFLKTKKVDDVLSGCLIYILPVCLWHHLTVVANQNCWIPHVLQNLAHDGVPHNVYLLNSSVI